MRRKNDPGILSLSDRVEIGGGLVGPRSFKVTWEPDGSPDDPDVTVEMMLEFSDGRYRCSEMNVSGSVTSEALHAIPVQRLVSESAVDAVVRLEPIADGKFEIVGGVLSPVALVDPEVAKDGPTDEALEAVATVYRVAYVAGLPPAKAVEETFDLATSTAARWIRKAREPERGLLGPAEHGRSTV